MRRVTKSASRPLLSMHSLKWVVCDLRHETRHLRSENPSGSRERFLNMTAEITSQMDGISPSTVSVTLGATHQFTSRVGTVWVAAYGTVTSGGLYTAPDTMPASRTDTVLVAGTKGAACADVHLLPASLPVAESWRDKAVALGSPYGDGQGERRPNQSGNIAERGESTRIEQPNLSFAASRMHSPMVPAGEDELRMELLVPAVAPAA